MKPFRTVRLRFGEDNATGEYGVLPKDTEDPDNGFNHSWNATMMFHDVFEHWQEHEHEHFKGKYAMNVGGEMYAMGACWYFYDCLRLNARSSTGIYSPQYQVANTTLSLVKAVVDYGDYTSFGDTLESSVPDQPKGDEELEYMIEQWWKEYKKPPEFKRDDPINWRYKRSVTKRKVQNLHRLGWHEAHRDFPPTYANINMVHDFWDFWDKFTKRHSAEELSNQYKEIVFTLSHDEKRNVSWTAEFVPDKYAGYPAFTINSEEPSLFLPDPEPALD